MMLNGSIFTSVLLVALTNAKSWVDQVGMGGSIRKSADPPIRHVCRPGSNTCRGLPTKPCTSSVISNPQASIFLNEAIYLHWNRNGLNIDETEHTCVKVGIAPFQRDPSFSSFTTLEECIPFNHGPSGISTDAYIMVPTTVPAGAYTVLWEWTQWGNTYTSCADITINSVSVPRPDLNPMPLSNTKSCVSGTPDPNTYCRARFGFQSYCRSWTSDKCSRSHCYGETAPDDSNCDDTFDLEGRRLEEEVYAPLHEQIYALNGCLGLPDNYCTVTFGDQSYCQPKTVDGCGRSLCEGDASDCSEIVEVSYQ